MTVIVNPSGTSWSTPDSPQAKSAQAVQFTSEGGPPGTEGTDPVYAWGQVTCADFRANKKWLPKAAEIEGADMASNQSAVRESVFIKSWARVLTKLCHDSKNPAYEPSGDALDAVVADLTKRGY